MPSSKRGDGDPLDICVLSERPITKSEVILNARVIGGLPMLDGGEADDKIIAVLSTDTVWQNVNELDELPPTIVERLRHYFMTYKLIPGDPDSYDVTIDGIYGRAQALKVIEAAIKDYGDEFGDD